MGFLSTEQMDAVEANRSGGQYLRTKQIEPGSAVKMRFLGDAITGVGGWRDGKPLRFAIKPSADEFDVDTLDVDMNGKPGMLRDFIACVVWNYKDEALQIFEISQVGIQDKLIALQKSDDWGDITTYDVSLKKTKKGDRIDYEVTPSPNGKGKLDKTIENAFDSTYIDLKKLYSNEDPFKKD